MDINDYTNEKYIKGSHNYNDNIFKIGNEQKRNCICKIETNEAFGSGFLCKIPFGSKQNLLPVFITNNHVIDENYIKKVGVIIFTKENDPNYYYNISFDIPRRFYTDKNDDFTIIEIKHEDNIELNSFLEIDDNIESPNPDLTYKNKEAYVIHFPLGNNAELNTGQIKSIKKDNKIFHKCSTNKGSSGCPILNSETCKVLGIHKASVNNKDENVGIFIRYLIDQFYIEMMTQGIDYYENYFDGINFIDIIYKINNPKEKLKLLGEKFVENNKNVCEMIINDYEYELCSFIDIKKYNYDNSGIFKIKLNGVKNITDMSYMFYKCKNLISVPNISQMNTSKITNMNRLFEGCQLLESLPDISSWDIGKVTDIRGMFFNCINLKKLPKISCWDTSSVKTMKEMFWSCSKLKHQDLPDINKWNLINCKDVDEAFDGYEFGKNKHIGDFIYSRIIKIPTGKF